MTDNEHLDFEDGFNGISRFTCYKPTYLVEEWENGKIIREWDIMRMKKDYFAFLVHLNELAKENERLRLANKILRANKKSCELGRRTERKKWKNFDKMRVKYIRFLQKKLKENGLSIYYE